MTPTTRNEVSNTMVSSHYQDDLESFLQCPDQWPVYNGYKRLDRKRKEIRVLTVWFSSRTQDLHGCLKHVDLEASPAFEALSYYWGPPDEQRSIVIDGQSVMIAKNLYNFLVALCSFGQKLPVWVDSLCIHQADVKERNHQVTMMGDIYRKATQVQAWIGDADADSNFALDYVRHFSTGGLLEKQSSPRLHNRALQAFRVFTARPYWERMWVIQELALASELLIVSGARRVRWDDFVAAISHISDVDFQSSRTPRDQPSESFWKLNGSDAHPLTDCFDRNEVRIARLHNLRSVGWSQSLFQLVARFGDHLCTDPRDKIYALHGIATQDFGPYPPVNYNKSTLEVFLEMLVGALGKLLSSQHSVENDRGVVMKGYRKAFVEDALTILRSLPISLSGLEPEFLQGSVRVPVHNIRHVLDLNPDEFEILPPSYLESRLIPKDAAMFLQNGDMQFRLSQEYSIIARVDRLAKQYQIIGLIVEPIGDKYKCASFATELCRIPQRTSDGQIGTMFVHMTRATLLCQTLPQYCPKNENLAFIYENLWKIAQRGSQLGSQLCTCHTSSLDTAAAVPEHDPMLSWLHERLSERQIDKLDSPEHSDPWVVEDETCGYRFFTNFDLKFTNMYSINEQGYHAY